MGAQQQAMMQQHMLQQQIARVLHPLEGVCLGSPEAVQGGRRGDLLVRGLEVRAQAPVLDDQPVGRMSAGEAEDEESTILECGPPRSQIEGSVTMDWSVDDDY